MTGYPILVFFAVVVISMAYIAQLASALRGRTSLAPVRLSVWTTVALIFIVPTLISIVMALSDSMLRNDLGVVAQDSTDELIGPLNLLRHQASDLMTIVQSIILAIISIELSHVTLGQLPQKWRQLLLIALVLDAATLVVVVLIRRMNYEAYELPVILCLLSILSSLVIVLIARGITESRLGGQNE